MPQLQQFANVATILNSVFRYHFLNENVSHLHSIIKYYTGIKYSFSIVVHRVKFPAGRFRDNITIHYMNVRPSGRMLPSISQFKKNLQDMNKIYVSFYAAKFLQFEIIVEQYPGISCVVVTDAGFMFGELNYFDVKLLCAFIHEVGVNQIQISFSNEKPRQFEVLNPSE